MYAVDPGARKTKGRQSYLATFDAGELIAVMPVTRESAAGLESPDVLVTERPQQDGRSQVVPPATLITLAWYGALTIGALRPRELVEFTPNEWKGQVSKPVHHLRIWRVLTPAERRCFPADTEARIRAGAEATARAGRLARYSFDATNLLDATGIGLLYIGRVGKGGARI